MGKEKVIPSTLSRVFFRCFLPGFNEAWSERDLAKRAKDFILENRARRPDTKRTAHGPKADRRHKPPEGHTTTEHGPEGRHTTTPREEGREKAGETSQFPQED